LFVSVLPIDTLVLTKNELEGLIPTELVRFKYRNIHTNTTIATLVLTLCSSYPQGNLANLAELRLNENSFTGTLPSEMGRLAGLGKCRRVGLVVVHTLIQSTDFSFFLLYVQKPFFSTETICPVAPLKKYATCTAATPAFWARLLWIV
jgi:hypothetical protein